ncbi:hypothetical protein [Microbacterium sp. NPDC080220]|uniref:hypothetical protein n=1 Tax=Microbacterium sp. NPDC080220 TaxID=3161017 RepID=UPI00342DF74B
MLIDLGAPEDGPYAVYWPRDSIVVAHGVSYEVARAIACVLRDDRTRWMGEPTTFAEPEIAVMRRDIGDFVTPEHARNGREYVKDRLLPADISTRVEHYEVQFAKGQVEFDFSTLPGS